MSEKQGLVNILHHACSRGPSLRAGPHHSDYEVNGQAACGLGGASHEELYVKLCLLVTSENKKGAQVFVMLAGVKSILYLQVF